MKELDDFLRQQLDPSKFPALIASAEKPAPKNAELQSQVDAAHRAQIQRIRDYAKANPGNPLVKANQHLLPEASGESWVATGNADMTSFYWWALGGGIAFPGLIPLAFLFGGKGSSWKAWTTFVSVIGGSFVVDPRKIVSSSEFRLEKDPVIGWVKKGPCNFALSEGGVGPAGGISMTFWSTSGMFWGTLGGYAPGIGGCDISGQLELLWQGFPQPPA